MMREAEGLLADEGKNRGENQKKSNFSDTHQVKAARCNLLFFWGKSDAKIISES